MFTGIITDIGIVKLVEVADGGKRFVISTAYDVVDIDMGASIACNGACMTVAGKAQGEFTIFMSDESLKCTNFDDVEAGAKINLERSLKMGDELGGHIVTGHVDVVTYIKNIEKIGENKKLTFDLPNSFAKFVAEKGSVTLNGVSLTVNNVDDVAFDVNLIPHSLENTIFGDAKVGDKINMEIDILARYVARMNAI